MTDSYLVDWLAEFLQPEQLEPLKAAIRESPTRISKAYAELLQPRASPEETLRITKLLPMGQPAAEVTVGPCNFAAVCAHHFLPFFGTAELTYLPKEAIVGIGKIPRFILDHSRGFWLQEELTVDLLTEFVRVIRPASASINLAATHLCMCARGPATAALTTTSYRIVALP